MGKSSVNTPALRSWLAAMLATAATYIYFLIFAEFAFLELAQAIVPTPDRMRWLMLALGGGGVTGAVLGAGVFKLSRQRALLAWAFRACAVSALAALFARTFLPLWTAGAAIGLSLGWLTVTLTAGLRSAAGIKRLGLCIGTGTGLAYAVCNVPGFFQAPAAVQTFAAAAIAGAASLLPRVMTCDLVPVAAVRDYNPRTVTRWVV